MASKAALILLLVVSMAGKTSIILMEPPKALITRISAEATLGFSPGLEKN